MAGLDIALDILSGNSSGLSQRRMQELQLSLMKMELEMKRDTMREEVLYRKEGRERENILYGLEKADVFLKEDTMRAAGGVIGNLMGLVEDYEEGDSVKTIKKALDDRIPDGRLQDKIASIIFMYHTEQGRISAIESATNLSKYIKSEYSLSKNTGEATEGFNELISAGLIEPPALGVDEEGRDIPNPNFDASVLPYILLDKTTDIKRNIELEHSQIAEGDYEIQEDVLLPSAAEAALEAVAMGTATQEQMDKALADLGSVVSGVKIKYDAPPPTAEAGEAFSDARNRKRELEKQKHKLEKLVAEGFTGETAAGLTNLNEQIAEQQEEYITKLNALREANRAKYDAKLEDDAKEHLAGAGLKETAKNIKAMKERLEKIRTSPVTLAIEDAPGF